MIEVYLVVSPNQLGYFKAETTARRLKVFLKETKDERRFLTYLRFIDVCSKLFVKIAPLRLELYQAEVIAIYQNKHWKHFMIAHLHYFRALFSNIQWFYMLHKLRQFQRLLLIAKIGEKTIPHLAEMIVPAGTSLNKNGLQVVYDSS